MSAQVIQLLPRANRRQTQTRDESLSDQDCFSIASALRLLPGAWLAQRDEEADGSVSMTLFTHEEEVAPAFTIRRDISGYRLEHGASTLILGRYGNARELMCAARHMLDS